MCDEPITLRNNNRRVGDEFATFLVPCGKCDKCLKSRAKSWFVRLKYELRHSTSAKFVTLTYENPPISFNGYETTVKSDLQKFLKRLRYYDSSIKINPKTGRKKRYFNDQLKYYAVSEYGEKSHRPHYHIILFNQFADKAIYNSWTKGLIHIGEVNNASINYVTGYVGKKIGIGQDDDDDREPEFSCMSKGLGLSYLEQTGQWNIKHETTHVIIDGLTYSTPRYLRNKMFPYYKINRTMPFKTSTGDTIVVEKLVQTPTQKRIGKKAMHKLIKDDEKKRKLHSLQSTQHYDYLKMQEAEIRNKKTISKNSKF